LQELGLLAVLNQNGAVFVNDAIVAAAEGIRGGGLRDAEFQVHPLGFGREFQRRGSVVKSLQCTGALRLDLLDLRGGKPDSLEVFFTRQQGFQTLRVAANHGLQHFLAHFLRRNHGPLVDAAITIFIEPPLAAVGPEPAKLKRLGRGRRIGFAVRFLAIYVVSHDVETLVVVADELAHRLSVGVADYVANSGLVLVFNGVEAVAGDLVSGGRGNGDAGLPRPGFEGFIDGQRGKLGECGQPEAGPKGERGEQPHRDSPGHP